jgi:hypothetical protein
MSASSVVGRELGGIVIVLVISMDLSVMIHRLLQDEAAR